MEKTKVPNKRTAKNKNDKKAQINNEVRDFVGKSIIFADTSNSYRFYYLQIIQLQAKFKQAKVATVRKLVDKLKHPDKNPKQNRAAKAERYKNVLNQIKVDFVFKISTR